MIWLTRLDRHTAAPPMKGISLTQQNKRFSPHLLAITVGTQVAFPNKDPFFHNVFSIYQGKPFDLGLYESGATRSVKFAKPGVSYIFCNIHPEMSAVVVALSTPYFAVTNNRGEFYISDLPPGSYELNIWYEGESDEALSKLSRKLSIDNAEYKLPAIDAFSSGPLRQHKNKYGEDYRSHEKTPYNF
ncbi:MAG: carboxypeptidase regulatory-like domain-containing protein [Acidobacteriaceae bacterium]